MVLTESALPASLEPEVELVRRARSGDRAAQEDLVHRHRRSLFLLALQLMGNRDDALDVVQDAFLRFFSTLGRFDARRPLRPWLSQIVRNRAVDLYRRRRVRRHEPLERGDDAPLLDLCDPRVDPEGDAARAELRLRLWQALDELSPKQREILVLRDYQDLSYAEIATALRIPIGTVMSRLHGARQSLRKILQDDLQNLLN